MLKILKKILEWINPKEGEKPSLFEIVFLIIIMMVEGKILWKLGEYKESIPSLGKQVIILGMPYILTIMIGGVLFLKIRLKAIGKQLDIYHEIAYFIVIFLEYCIAFTIAFLCIGKSLIESALLGFFWYIIRGLVSNGIVKIVSKLYEWFKGPQSNE